MKTTMAVTFARVPSAYYDVNRRSSPASRTALPSDLVATVVRRRYRRGMALTYRISQAAIDRYARGPTASRTTQVKALHQSIRAALENWGDKNYDTFLQGSYRNGTAVADINDVDIVALYDPWHSPASASQWRRLSEEVADILEKTSLVSVLFRSGTSA